MAIRPLRMKMTKEDYEEMNKMAKNPKLKQNSTTRVFSIFRSGMGVVIVTSMIFGFAYKTIYNRVFVKNSSREEIEEYQDFGIKTETKESEWMTKSIFHNEIKSNKNDKI